MTDPNPIYSVFAELNQLTLFRFPEYYRPQSPFTPRHQPGSVYLKPKRHSVEALPEYSAGAIEVDPLAPVVPLPPPYDPPTLSSRLWHPERRRFEQAILGAAAFKYHRPRSLESILVDALSNLPRRRRPRQLFDAALGQLVSKKLVARSSIKGDDGVFHPYVGITGWGLLRANLEGISP